MKKIRKKIAIMLIILITLLASIIFPKPSMATGNSVELYATHRYGNLLVREGIDLTTIYIVYQKDGIEYPSYCLQLELDGATENFSYSVNTDSQITDMEIWRTVVNGYPYKTPEELGCATKEEAYLATRQAIYCAVYDRDPNSYGAIGGEAGARTLNAMKSIVNIARTSTEVKPSATLNITGSNAKWEIDTINSNYVSKEFTVTASAGIKNYTVALAGDVIEGTKIADINNVEKKEFTDGEKIKILIPIKNIQKDGNFIINVNGEVATKPVIFGLSPSSTLQNVALTGSIYETGSGSKTEYYFKNETKIEILKQNQETKAPLENVKFQILDENKKVIYADLSTNNQGIITVENLLPGKYYVQEMETLEGYEVYDKLIEVNLKLNEAIKITVNNLYNTDIQKIEKINTELEVEQTKTEIAIEQNNIKIQEVEQNVEIKEQETQVKMANNNTVVKLPKTGM